MGLLTRLIAGARESRNGFTMNDAIQAFLRGDDTYPVATYSGATVNETSAMSVTAVYACIKLIGWTLAMLPLPVYKRLQPRGKSRATDHPLYRLLHDSPNPEMTAFQWRAVTSAHQNLWGAGISEIEFNRTGQPVALWPIPPWRVEVKIADDNKSVFYKVNLSNGTSKFLPSYQTFVVPALGTSPYAWMSPIAVHRETIGAAMAVKEFGARTFGSGTNPAGILMVPGKLTEETEKALDTSLQKYAGLGKSHRVMLIEEGMKWERVGLPPQDAQYLDTRRFDISEIARIYNVPLYMLQDHEKQTSWGAGIEEQKDGFVTFTLAPYAAQWEQEFQRRLFFDDQYFPEFLFSGLLRGKLIDRYNAYKIGREGGWLSADDIREIENMNELPEDQGKVYLVPMNFQNAKFAGEKPEAPSTPVKKEEPKK